MCVFSFLGKKSLKIKKTQKNCKVLLKELLLYCKLKVIFKYSSEIVNDFYFEDVLPKKICTGIVYSFKYNSWNAIYYGKTKRHIYVRVTKRMGILHLLNKPLKMLSNQLFQITC